MQTRSILNALIHHALVADVDPLPSPPANPEQLRWPPPPRPLLDALTAGSWSRRSERLAAGHWIWLSYYARRVELLTSTGSESAATHDAISEWLSLLLGNHPVAIPVNEAPDPEKMLAQIMESASKHIHAVFAAAGRLAKCLDDPKLEVGTRATDRIFEEILNPKLSNRITPGVRLEAVKAYHVAGRTFAVRSAGATQWRHLEAFQDCLLPEVVPAKAVAILANGSGFAAKRRWCREAERVENKGDLIATHTAFLTAGVGGRVDFDGQGRIRQAECTIDILARYLANRFAPQVA